MGVDGVVVVFIVRAGFGRTLEEGVHEKGELGRSYCKP